MKDEELFELCKEVYERTEWGEETDPDLGVYNWEHDGRKKPRLNTDSYEELDHDKDEGVFFDGGYPIWVAPLYTSDYLLEKLPESIATYLYKAYDEDGALFWLASDGLVGDENMPNNYEGRADTPLKALLKLVIALDDAGVKL